MTARTKPHIPIGSAQWIQDENEQIEVFRKQEVEDFAFSARNEIEWLNEHMADIFSKNQVNVAEIFKTPGKLQGKTPRTARKRNPLEVRQPLTDVFRTNAPLGADSSCAKSPLKENAEFRVAEDPVVISQSTKSNTDSGYHGMSGDDMDVDLVPTAASTSIQLEEKGDTDTSEPIPQPEPNTKMQMERQRTTEGSFHTANENTATIESSKDAPQDSNATTGNIIHEVPAIMTEHKPSSLADSLENALENVMELDGMDNKSVLKEVGSVDASHMSSAESSPGKPLVRKSSLTFATLPAREPLTTKKSIGTRVSGTSHFEQSRATLNRGSFLERYTGGKSIGGSRQVDRAHGDDSEVDQTEMPALAREKSDGDTKIARLHNKSSTQRLHDKISMLGKSQPTRPTKSIPAAATVTHPTYPGLHTSGSQLQNSGQVSSKTAATDTSNNDDDDDDDWIQPPKPHTFDPKLSVPVKSDSNDALKTLQNERNVGDEQVGVGNHDRDSGDVSYPTVPTSLFNPQQEKKQFSDNPPESVSSSCQKAGKGDQTKASETLNSALHSLPGDECSKTITTALSTPSKRHVDGPLSASKSKLQSIMKTARGLFSSSAGVSAQAKMETLSTDLKETHGQTWEPALSEKQTTGLKPLLAADGMPSHTKQNEQAEAVATNLAFIPTANASEGRKTRSSTEKMKEKEKQEKEKHRIETDTEREEDMGNGKLVTHEHEQAQTISAKIIQSAEVDESSTQGSRKVVSPTRKSPRRPQIHQRKQESQASESQAGDVENAVSIHAMAPPSHSQPQSSQQQRPKELRRPAKPAKEAAPKPKPQPVAIRVGTLSQRIPLTNAVSASTLQDPLPPPPPPKRPGPVKKGSNNSLQTSGSSTSLKGSASSSVTKPKALLAAERKKEQDEKEVQRKLEQKRDIERKRAAQQEEVRRQEQAQRQESERQRERERSAMSEDPKKTASRQAIEKRRLENGKKEQQRQASHQEKPQPLPTINRPELGGVRPPSRLHTVQDYGRPVNPPPINPARPPVKRVFDPEQENETIQSVRIQTGQSYQQTDAKRRRTDDEDMQDAVMRPTMKPPIRQSNIRKDASKQPGFCNGHVTAHPLANTYHQSNSLLKTSTLNQTYQQHQHSNQVPRAGLPHELAKYANGRIPFAEAPNPPPKSPLYAEKPTAAPAKSSPQYVNGENIDLAEIATDSEDESEDEKAKGAMLPDWVQSPQLREQLELQERYVDADAVFGPPASPHMEEMFKGREHRYRSRTSSANWAGSDRLTEEEIRNDRMGREKLRRQGGWSFDL